MKESPLISEHYRALNRELHETNPAYGTSGYKYAKRVADLAERYRAKTLLDYGCGKRVLDQGIREHYGDAPVLEVINYDPCIPGFESAKRPADIVACIDVLEHIEPERLDAVLDDIKANALKAVFLMVATRPAKKVLSDGRNAHLIQRPYSWWLQKLMARFRLLAFENHDNQQFLAVLDNPHATAFNSQAANGRTGTNG